MTEIKIALGRYQHYKGKQYEVIGQAFHSETLEPMVVYKALYASAFPEGTWWVRPLKMFFETVQVDGRAVPRFQKLSP